MLVMVIAQNYEKTGEKQENKTCFRCSGSTKATVLYYVKTR